MNIETQQSSYYKMNWQGTMCPETWIRTWFCVVTKNMWKKENNCFSGFLFSIRRFFILRASVKNKEVDQIFYYYYIIYLSWNFMDKWELVFFNIWVPNWLEKDPSFRFCWCKGAGNFYALRISTKQISKYLTVNGFQETFCLFHLWIRRRYTSDIHWQ